MKKTCCFSYIMCNIGQFQKDKVEVVLPNQLDKRYHMIFHELGRLIFQWLLDRADLVRLRKGTELFFNVDLVQMFARIEALAHMPQASNSPRYSRAIVA